MSQAKLTHTLGDNINQSLLIRDNLCCFLKKLSRHMAQGTNRAECLGRELKDTRHATCKRGGNELRCEHDKMSVDFPNEAARCQRFLSGRAQSNSAKRATLRQRDISAGSGNGTAELGATGKPQQPGRRCFVLRTQAKCRPQCVCTPPIGICLVTAVAPKL